MKNETGLNCLHNKKCSCIQYPNILFCLNCSQTFFKDKEGNEFNITKPRYLLKNQVFDMPLFMLNCESDTILNFQNREKYLKIRTNIVKNMKKNCQILGLSKKIYFLSLQYLDIICSKLNSFNINNLTEISIYCIIIATKFLENRNKYLQIRENFNNINNYGINELYILKLLNNNLCIHTSYDILMEFVNFGFILDDEKCSFAKVRSIYSKIEDILYFFSEKKYFIDMTNKQIAFSFILFFREIIGLQRSNKLLNYIFSNQNFIIDDNTIYIEYIKKYIKIKEEKNIIKNHNDSTSDTGSESNSDHNTEL